MLCRARNVINDNPRCLIAFRTFSHIITAQRWGTLCPRSSATGIHGLGLGAGDQREEPASNQISLLHARPATRGHSLSDQAGAKPDCQGQSAQIMKLPGSLALSSNLSRMILLGFPTHNSWAPSISPAPSPRYPQRTPTNTRRT